MPRPCSSTFPHPGSRRHAAAGLSRARAATRPCMRRQRAEARPLMPKNNKPGHRRLHEPPYLRHAHTDLRGRGHGPASARRLPADPPIPAGDGPGLARRAGGLPTSAGRYPARTAPCAPGLQGRAAGSRTGHPVPLTRHALPVPARRASRVPAAGPVRRRGGRCEDPLLVCRRALRGTDPA
jgi:hypothetical protein